MPKLQKNEGLSWVSLGFALASVHYGLGFLVGSGESVYNEGPTGILYAVSTGLGLFALAFITSFYRKRKFPIWDLLGNKYGEIVRKLVLFLSSFWMVGVVASQILGGSAALTIFKIPQIVSMGVIAVGIYLLSVLNIGRLSKIFFYMLMLSSALLILVLIKLGFQWFPLGLVAFFKSSGSLSLVTIVEVAVTTVLITVLGMDFHQFVVKAKTNTIAREGCIFGGVLLLLLSFVLLGIFLAGISLGINPQNSREFVPLLLQKIGSLWGPVFGVIFCIPIVMVSAGSGSAVTKIVASSLDEFVGGHRRINYRLLTVLVGLLIAMIGKSIVSLIVSFYAIYIAALLVPFVLYLLESKKIIVLPKYIITLTLTYSAIAGIIAFVVSLLPGSFCANFQTVMILMVGLTAGAVVSIYCYLRKYSLKLIIETHRDR